MVIVPPLTAQFTWLLLTPAVVTCSCRVCEVVRLDKAGESESGPWIGLGGGIGGTGTSTGAEEATPPHEIRNIFSRRTRKRNEKPEHNGDNDRTYRGRWITPALPREDWFRGCKSNGLRIDSAESREVPGDSAEVTTT